MPILCQSLSREWAAFHKPAPGPNVHFADPFIEAGDEGMTVASVRALFTGLRAELVPLAHAITSQPPADDSCLHLHYPEAQQLAFSLEAAQRIGYDLARGRLDKTPHPFMTRLAGSDVRITTRVHEHDLGDCLFSVLHETGHALYELGVAPELDDTTLGTPKKTQTPSKETTLR